MDDADLNVHLANANAEAVELMVALDERNQALADANAHAAELMADLEIRDERIRRLNDALSESNTRLVQLLAELETSNEDLRCFAYAASHDLKEPLRTIMGYVEILQEEYGAELDEAATRYITVVLDSVGRMQAMLEGILGYARVGTSKAPLEPVPGDKIFHDVCQDLERAITSAGAVVTAGTLPVVRGDDAQLHQLLQNLIANAIKFRTDEPPQVQVNAEVSGGESTWTVRDNGIGLDPQHAERIFQVFQRLHGRAEYEGTGIGLAICKRIVERHGGRIWVTSEPGLGTIFHFTLPVAT